MNLVLLLLERLIRFTVTLSESEIFTVGRFEIMTSVSLKFNFFYFFVSKFSKIVFFREVSVSLDYLIFINVTVSFIDLLMFIESVRLLLFILNR